MLSSFIILLPIFRLAVAVMHRNGALVKIDVTYPAIRFPEGLLSLVASSPKIREAVMRIF